MKPFLGMLYWVIISLVVGNCFGCRTEGLQQSTGSRGRSSTDSGVDSIPDIAFPKLDSEPKLDTMSYKDIAIQTSPDTHSDSTVFNQLDTQNDAFSKTQDVSPDLKKFSIGTTCNSVNQCASGNCIDGVCCSVPKCVDSCVPSSTSTCPTYSGWTCAPYGTCRAF